MHKRVIKYKDLDNNPVEDTFEFHLSRAEMAEMALGKEGRAGGFDVWIRRLIESNDGEVITQTFKEILLKTIGRRSEDNKRFIKSDEIIRDFVQSDAYSVLFMELIMDAEKMSEFVNAVVPEDMKDEVKKSTAAVAAGQNPAFKGPQARLEEKAPPEEPKDDRPDWLKDPNRIPTTEELKGATTDQLQEAFRRRSAGTGPVTHEQITGQ